MRTALSAPETATGPMGPLLFLVLAETVTFEQHRGPSMQGSFGATAHANAIAICPREMRSRLK